MTLLGGMGTFAGPVIGAFTIIGLQNFLADRVGSWVTVIIGAIFVVCVVAFRRGFVGELLAWQKRAAARTERRARPAALTPLKRGVEWSHPPFKEADDHGHQAHDQGGSSAVARRLQAGRPRGGRDARRRSAGAAVQALLAQGFERDDILEYTAAEENDEMDRMLQHTSDFAGFGYEVTLMRTLQGAGARRARAG